MELERRVQSSEKENKVLFQRIERVKSEKEEVELRLQEQDQEVQHTRQRLNQHKDSSQENDSHAWWIYVWHEVKKQGGMLKDLQFQFDSQISGGIADRLRSSLQSGTGSVEMPGDFNYEVLSESGAAAHIAKLRENIRSQALEIATARQVMSFFNPPYSSYVFFFSRNLLQGS